MTTNERPPGEVLVVAPLGKDAALTVQVLQRAEIGARVCADLKEAGRSLGETTTALLLAEEALVPAQLPRLLKALQSQPPWSDLPVVLLTSSGGSERMSLQAVDLFGPAGNVTLLERPLHSVTLVSAMKVALRARQRQYEVRELIEQRETVLSSISDAFSAIDHEWRYTYVNDRVAEMAGLPKEEMLGRNIWEVFPDAVGTEFDRLAHQVMERAPTGAGRIFPQAVGHLARYPHLSDEGRDRHFPGRHFGAESAGADRARTRIEIAGERGSAAARDGSGRYRHFRLLPANGRAAAFGTRRRNCSAWSRMRRRDYETYLAALHPEDRHLASETVARVLEPGNNDRYDIEYRTIGLGDGRERWVAEKGRVVFGAVRRSGALPRDVARHYGEEERRDPLAARQTTGGGGQSREGPVPRHAFA